MISVWIYLCFVLTYAGVAVGHLPWLRVDRTGIALLGLTLLLLTSLTLDEIGARIDVPTLLLLFALMIVSSHFVDSGFCDAVFERIAHTRGGPIRMLAMTVALSGAMAAFLANDIFVFVAAPLVLDTARERGFDPRPYLIALIASANAGSAATIIGAPQTIVIGELGGLQLPTYLLACGVPAMVALLIVFLVIVTVWAGRFELEGDVAELPLPLPHRPHDRHQTNIGIVALACLLALFCTDLTKDVWALGIAAIPLLFNRQPTTRAVLAGVDWPLLLLVACLFGVTGALGATALPGFVVDHLQAVGLMPDSLAVLSPLTILMSCTLGNVPGTILFLQIWQDAPPGTLYGLALLSTLAGNLLLIASLSNVIIAERAAERGVVLHHREFARVGIPVTLLSLGFAVFWLWAVGLMPLLPGGHP